MAGHSYSFRGRNVIVGGGEGFRYKHDFYKHDFCVVY